MEGTIEVNHRNVLQNISILEACLEQISEYYNANRIEVSTIEEKKYRYITKMLKDILEKYLIDVIDVLAHYYKNNRTEKLESNYYKVLIGNNYLGKMQMIYKYVKDFAKVNKLLLSSETNDIINKKIEEYEINKIKPRKIKHKYDICECGTKMNFIPFKSELLCNSCNKTVIVYGYISENNYNSSNLNIIKQKQGHYDPNRHCKFWVQRIQANDINAIPKDCIDAIRKCIIRDNIINKKFTECSLIRKYLKETGYTEYNDSIPLIRKKITGYCPPQLKTKELRVLYNIFNKSIEVFEKVKPSRKSNTMYYPYIIFKILEHILPSSRRRMLILECIHLQSRDTLIANDNLWEKMCDEMNLNIKYKPTDREDQIINF